MIIVGVVVVVIVIIIIIIICCCWFFFIVVVVVAVTEYSLKILSVFLQHGCIVLYAYNFEDENIFNILLQFDCLSSRFTTLYR